MCHFYGFKQNFGQYCNCRVSVGFETLYCDICSRRLCMPDNVSHHSSVMTFIPETQEHEYVLQHGSVYQTGECSQNTWLRTYLHAFMRLSNKL